MADIATCAKCGKRKELCESVRIDGLKQPRICKECLLAGMRTGDESCNDIHWIVQMAELDDTESMKIIREQYVVTP